MILFLQPPQPPTPDTFSMNDSFNQWWTPLAINIAYGIAGIGILVLLIYAIRLIFTSGNKAKYDFISLNEIRFLFIATIFFIVSAIFFFNRKIESFSTLSIFARVFIGISAGVLVGIVVQVFLKFYYPFFIEKRLRHLRYRPRISPKTGKPMKLLSEEEEDVYLDEGMQAEEDVFSVDYDVWRDEETGYIQIDKYSGHLHALRCHECNYQTLKLVKEEVISVPTLSYEGELLKHYKCSYCGHKAKKSVVLRKQHPSAVTQK